MSHGWSSVTELCSSGPIWTQAEATSDETTQEVTVQTGAPESRVLGGPVHFLQGHKGHSVTRAAGHVEPAAAPHIVHCLAFIWATGPLRSRSVQLCGCRPLGGFNSSCWVPLKPLRGCSRESGSGVTCSPCPTQCCPVPRVLKPSTKKRWGRTALCAFPRWQQSPYCLEEATPPPTPLLVAHTHFQIVSF